MDKLSICLIVLHRMDLITHLSANKKSTSSQTTFISIISLRLPNAASIRSPRKKQTRSLDSFSRVGNNAVEMHFPWTEIQGTSTRRVSLQASRLIRSYWLFRRESHDTSPEPALLHGNNILQLRENRCEIE